MSFQTAEEKSKARNELKMQADRLEAEIWIQSIVEHKITKGDFCIDYDSDSENPEQLCVVVSFQCPYSVQHEFEFTTSFGDTSYNPEQSEVWIEIKDPKHRSNKRILELFQGVVDDFNKECDSCLKEIQDLAAKIKEKEKEMELPIDIVQRFSAFIKKNTPTNS